MKQWTAAETIAGLIASFMCGSLFIALYAGLTREAPLDPAKAEMLSDAYEGMRMVLMALVGGFVRDAMTKQDPPTPPPAPPLEGDNSLVCRAAPQ